MPIKRKLIKKRRPRRQKRPATAAKALNMVKKIENRLRPETKFFDVSVNATTVTDTGYISGSLCNPGQGIGRSLRIGDNIFIKKMTLKMMLFQPSGSVVDEIIRVIVFLDKENTVNAVSNFLLNPANGFNSPYSIKNPTYFYNTKTLFDRMYRLTTDNPINNIDVVIPIFKHCHFATTLTTVEQNDIKIIIIGQNTPGANSYNYVSHITYTDN